MCKRKLHIIVLSVITTFVVLFASGCASDDNSTNPDNTNVPTLTTNAVSAVSQTMAESGGNITSDGGATVTARGVCWSTSATPTVSDSKTSDGTGTGGFSSSITGLTANTLYYVRAYATNSTGTGYGNAHSFTTDASLNNGCTIVWERGNPNPTWQWDLASISCDGTDSTQLTTTGSGGWPMWRPDGEKLLWIFNQAGCDELWTMNADGSGKQLIYSGITPCLRDNGHEWSPDGNTIAILEHLDGGGTDALYTINAIGGPTTKVIDSVDAVKWKRDGSRLALKVHDSLLVCEPNGQSVQTILSVPGKRVSNVIGWKGTSDTVVFVLTDIVSSADSLASIRMDGTAYRSWVQFDYTTYDNDVDNIALTFIGDRVVYERSNQMYTLSFATGTEQSIPVAYSARHVEISVDGQWIAVINNGNTDADIILFHIDGSNLQNITSTPNLKEKGPRFRPTP